MYAAIELFDCKNYSNLKLYHRNLKVWTITSTVCQVQAHKFARFWATYVIAFLRHWANAYTW